MKRLLQRQFDVPASLQEAWDFLARVDEWPRWAKHIRRVDASPPSPIGPNTSGAIHLRNGIKSTFRVSEFRPQQNWKWTGPFLWLTLHYDHRFVPIDANCTQFTWTVDAEGFGVTVFGPLFAAIYARDLDKAIPSLVSSFKNSAG
jgi:hypothetical protein